VDNRAPRRRHISHENRQRPAWAAGWARKGLLFEVPIKRDMATKDQIITLHTQVNSIETQIRGMKHVKLEARVADIEEEVFGKTRA